MQLIINDFKKYTSPDKFYLQRHEKLFELMVLIHEFSYSGKIIKKDKLKNLQKVGFEYSYKDVIAIFITILNYHTKKDKPEYLNKYIQITKKLNYPLFSKQYLVSYFDV